MTGRRRRGAGPRHPLEPARVEVGWVHDAAATRAAQTSCCTRGVSVAMVTDAAREGRGRGEEPGPRPVGGRVPRVPARAGRDGAPSWSTRSSVVRAELGFSSFTLIAPRSEELAPLVAELSGR